MITILKREIKNTRKGLFIWCLIAGLIAYLGILEYPMLAPSIGAAEKAIAMIPKLGQLVFGIYHVNFSEPVGYYIVMYYWTGLIVFTHAMYVGASIILKEQRDKTAEFIFTKPYQRSTIVWAKILAGLFNICVMCIVTVTLSLVGMLQATGDMSLSGTVILSGVGQLFTQLTLLALGLLCSAHCKTYRSSVIGAMLVLLGSYCLMFFIQFIEMPMLNFLSPLTFFGVSEVTASGLNWLYVALAVAIIAVCGCAATRLYSKKVLV